MSMDAFSAYSIDIARQRFSLWCAARAAQAGSAKARRNELIAALKACGVREWIADPVNHSATLEQYDQAFHRWVIGVQRHLKLEYKKPISYGIAAKLVSTYLKGVFVLGGCHTSSLAGHITPPIDSILLRNIDKATRSTLAKTHKWQKLTKDQYNRVVAALRRANGAAPAWHLESHWEP